MSFLLDIKHLTTHDLFPNEENDHFSDVCALAIVVCGFEFAWQPGGAEPLTAAFCGVASLQC